MLLSISCLNLVRTPRHCYRVWEKETQGWGWPQQYTGHTKFRKKSVERLKSWIWETHTHTHTHSQIRLDSLVCRGQASSSVVVSVSFITNRCNSALVRLVMSFCLSAVQNCKTAEGIFMLLYLLPKSPTRRYRHDTITVNTDKDLHGIVRVDSGINR